MPLNDTILVLPRASREMFHIIHLTIDLIQGYIYYNGNKTINMALATDIFLFSFMSHEIFFRENFEFYYLPDFFEAATKVQTARSETFCSVQQQTWSKRES